MRLIKKLLLFVGLVAVFCIFGFIENFSAYPTYKVEGASMEPTYHSGDEVKVNKSETPKIGDVLVIDCPSKCLHSGSPVTLIKRITQIDGDKIWVEGDNKEHSGDSRVYGWLSPSDFKLLGVVIQ